MHEKVSIALVRGDESIALLIVEPLDRTGGHALVPSPLPTAPVSLRDPCTRLHFLPDSVRMPRQKYHPTRLKGAPRSETSAALEGRLTRAFFEERANRVLQILGREQRRRDLPHPVVGAAYPMLQIGAHHSLGGRVRPGGPGGELLRERERLVAQL